MIPLMPLATPLIHELTDRLYLFFDIIEWRGRYDWEADEKDVCHRVAERSEAVEVLLAGSVKESQGIWYTTNRYRPDIGVEYLSSKT